MNKVKSIVTGGAGFIGSHLVDSLVQLNHEVIVLDNLKNGKKSNLKKSIKNIKIIKCELSKYGKWVDVFKEVDYVFHLAGLADIVPSITHPTKYFQSNVNATLNVLRASSKIKIKKFLYSASSSCYGIPEKFPTRESAKIDCKYPYALSKKIGEDLIVHWGNIYKLPYVSLRLFNVYGPRSRTNGAYGAVFGVFLKQKLSNFPLTIVGNGNQKRDFIYISDVVNAFIKSAMSKKKNKIYNVGSGKAIKINDIAKYISDKKVFIPKRPGEPEITKADISKIRKDLNWQPRINIKNGINIVMDNINYWKDSPLWTSSKISHATKNWFKFLK